MSLFASRYKVVRREDKSGEPVINCVAVYNDGDYGCDLLLVVYEWFDGSKRGTARPESLMKDMGFPEGQLVMIEDLWKENGD